MNIISKNNMRDGAIMIVIVLLGFFLYGMTIRGSLGNGTPAEVKSELLDQSTGALELSPERGRFAHVVNLATRGSYDLDEQWANLVYPDVGFANGKFYSFFAPGVSYMATPFYIVGSKFDMGQLGAFSVEMVMGILALLFIYKICRNIFGLPRELAFFSVLVFGFGSTFWSYVVTLYQHAFTVFFMMSGVYAAWRFRSGHGGKWNWLYALYVWFIYGLSFSVDYPNLFLLLPIMVYMAFSSLTITKVKEGYSVVIRWMAVVTAIAFFAIIGVQLWHNAYYYGSWKQLAGGLPTYVKPVATTTARTLALSPAGTNATTTATVSLTSTTTAGSTTPKDVVHFFDEKYIPNSLYILLVSPDRGLVLFCPIFLLAIFGITYAFQKLNAEHGLLLGLIGVNIFLYGSWGDPWGGWAYGPRYIIPSMACLAIFVGIGLFHLDKVYKDERWKRFLIRLGAFILFMYSSAIGLLGALTTNAVPPKSEALLLPVKKYNFLLNLDYMFTSHSGTFVYNTYFSDTLTLFGYFTVIYLIVLAAVVATLFVPLFFSGTSRKKAPQKPS